MAGPPTGERDQAELSETASDVRVKRRLVAIPEDQNLLLEKPDSWYETLRKRQHGLYNIPASVFNGLKNLERAKRERAAAEQPPSRSEALPPPSTPHTTTRLQPGKPAPKPVPREDGDSDADTAISWEPTPSRREPALPPQPEDSPVAPKEKPAQRATRVLRQLPAYPPSDGLSQPELDIEVPGALSAGPVNHLRGLESGFTPPSAQVMPPRTQSSIASPEKEVPRQRELRKREQKRILFPDAPDRGPASPSPRSSIPPSLPKNVHRGRSVPTLRPANGRSDGQSHSPVEEMPVAPALASHTPRPSRNPDVEPPRPRKSVGNEHSIQQREGSRVQETPGPDRNTVQAMDLDETEIIPSTRGAETPFTAYATAYLDYTGTEDDFLRAVSYVGDQQKTGQLASFLYDDVIRAFYEDFIPYLQSTDSEPPMVMWKWYNRHVKSLRYNKNVVTLDNLGKILEFYSEEIRAIRGQPQDADSEASRKPSASAGVEEGVDEEEVTALRSDQVPHPEILPLGTAPKAALPTLANIRAARPEAVSPPPTSQWSGGWIPDSQAVSSSAAADRSPSSRSLASPPKPPPNIPKPVSTPASQEEDVVMDEPEQLSEETARGRFLVPPAPTNPSPAQKAPQVASLVPESSYAAVTRRSRGSQPANSPSSSRGGQARRTMSKAELERRSARYKRYLDRKHGASRPVSTMSSFGRV